MTDEELNRAAAELGSREVAGLDGERISRHVLARLQTEPAGAVRPILPIARRIGLGLAAAALIVLMVRLSLGGERAALHESPAPVSLLSELDGLNVSELEQLLESMPPASDASVSPEPVTIDELDIKSLERLLRSLEG